MKQHRGAERTGVESHLRGISTLAAAILGGNAATACGGRTLETAPYGDADSMGTSTTAVMMGDMLGPGACDAPYDLGTAVGSFRGVTAGSSTFISACSGGGPETFLLWTAPETGTYRINTFGSEVDTVLSQLLQPNCESLGIVQCSDDANEAHDSELLLTAVAGQVFTLVVDSFEPGGRFRFEIVRSKDPARVCGPVLEQLSGVGPLVDRALPLDDNTLDDRSTDMCLGMAPRVAFGWMAPASGTFTFDTFGSNYDTVLVLRADCNDTLGGTCNDNSDGMTMQSQVSMAVRQGQVVRVEIAAHEGYASSTDGLELRLMLNARPQ